MMDIRTLQDTETVYTGYCEGIRWEGPILLQGRSAQSEVFVEEVMLES